MNKKNFPIFISLLIMSAFITFIFYQGYSNINSNKKLVLSDNYYHAEIGEKLTPEEIKKLNNVENVVLAGGVLPENTSALINDSRIAISYEDQDAINMHEFSYLLDGEFPKNTDEILLSKDVCESNNLKIGDTVEISFGKRIINGEAINPIDAVIKNETFKTEFTKSLKLVGIYENQYNKNSKIAYGLMMPDVNMSLVPVLKFKDFVHAYKNSQSIESNIDEVLGRTESVRFNQSLVHYYSADRDFTTKIASKIVTIFIILVTIILFVFFIRNLFKVWAIKKIKELSVYKSIGSTDFQIYKMLSKEAVFISIIPILIGHIIGFIGIIFLFKYIRGVDAPSIFIKVEFNAVLSVVILAISFIVVLLSIISPARKVSKINIIDGIKGNIDYKESKKRRSENIWSELSKNNRANLKSQRYISSIGIIIISFFIVALSINLYFNDYYFYDDGYNILVQYYSRKNQIPPVFEKIINGVQNDKSYISKKKYVSVKYDFDLSDEAISKNVDKNLKKYMKSKEKESLDGYVIALDDYAFKKLGGEKGKILLFNNVQTDMYEPNYKAKMVSYIDEPDELSIKLYNGEEKKIHIDGIISDRKDFETYFRPYGILIYTNFEEYFKLFGEESEPRYGGSSFVLRLHTNDLNSENLDSFISKTIDENLSKGESYNYEIGMEIQEKQEKSTQLFKLIVLVISAIIIVLNITNAYSSINLSLLSREREIGSLYSCGMDKKMIHTLLRKEFIAEEIKSFVIAVVATFVFMFILSSLSEKFNFKILLKEFGYLEFLISSVLVYVINIFIYNITLRKILQKPIIEIIKEE
ncbi:MAG: ABC transporter permease [Ezakiella sp.]|uniref:ABC transporter permease n=1 Tax=Ezakiella sp. TaxID=1935205 RepID=UPI0029757742|nr:ABC transporter permease [Ezakiella sp.]MDD7731565.1 ABC transporter permease [Eubacteriales bacterium]MDY6079504.1 ABC transporter permease [Ezakiella sp.]